ncbi:MAG: SAVED domain-containing protein [Alphaproteobacteria bacterium]|nr:SAVED domain-containing protein [Alphaproteobacteria bacterium]
MFWTEAARLLTPRSGVARVAYETSEPQGFDDIAVAYEPSLAPFDWRGQPVLEEFLQCKWRVRPQAFGFENLVGPDAISPILANVKKAVLNFPGPGRRFVLMTNQGVTHTDPLAKLVRYRGGALDVAALEKDDEFRKVREHWCRHLDVNVDELVQIISHFIILMPGSTLDDAKKRMNDALALAGLKTSPPNETACAYDALASALRSQGRASFDRTSFLEMCRKENLIDPHASHRPPPPFTVGIRSMINPLRRLEDRCDHLVDLAPEFLGRHLRTGGDWRDLVLAPLREQLREVAQRGASTRFILECHSSIAYAGGAINRFSPAKTLFSQRTEEGERDWGMGDQPERMDWPGLAVAPLEEFDPGKPDIALAVGISQPVKNAVKEFIKGLPVGRLLVCEPEQGVGRATIRCGQHAFLLAERVQKELTNAGGGQPGVTTHLFLAAPNVFSWFLGRHYQVMGNVITYEYDLEGTKAYSAALTISPQDLLAP